MDLQTDIDNKYPGNNYLLLIVDLGVKEYLSIKR